MKNHEPYDEGKLAHQEPVQAISSWQEFNDVDGSDAIEHELLLQSFEDEDEVALAQRTVE